MANLNSIIWEGDDDWTNISNNKSLYKQNNAAITKAMAIPTSHQGAADPTVDNLKRSVEELTELVNKQQKQIKFLTNYIFEQDDTKTKPTKPTSKPNPNIMGGGYSI